MSTAGVQEAVQEAHGEYEIVLLVYFTLPCSTQ